MRLRLLVVVQFQVSALDGGRWLTSRPGCFISGELPTVPIGKEDEQDAEAVLVEARFSSRPFYSGHYADLADTNTDTHTKSDRSRENTKRDGGQNREIQVTDTGNRWETRTNTKIHTGMGQEVQSVHKM
jgi:hypothetical protein